MDSKGAFKGQIVHQKCLKDEVGDLELDWSWPTQEYALEPMNTHGYPWVPMGTHGVPMGTHGVPMGTHGYPWAPMGTHGHPWVPMGTHG